MATRIIVKGKISNVRYLENAPYFARKVRGGSGYYQYVFEMENDDEAQIVAMQIEGSYDAYVCRDELMEIDTGVWTETENADALFQYRHAEQTRDVALRALGMTDAQVVKLVQLMTAFGSAEEIAEARAGRFSSKERMTEVNAIFEAFNRAIDAIEW